MKSFKSTWIFLAVVLCIVGLAVFQYLKDQKDDKSKTEKAMLIPDADRDIVEIRIQSKDSELFLRRDDNNWKILKPVEDMADESAASSFAQSFATQKVQETEKSGSNVDWKQYGFDQDGVKDVHLKSTTGKEFHVSISGRNAFDGRYYLKMGDKLLLGEVSWASLLARESSTLRDKRLLRESIEPSEVRIQNGKKTIKLTRANEKWGGPAELRLDPDKVDRYIGDLLEAVADGIVPNRDGTTKLGEIIVVQADKPTTITLYSRKSAVAKNPGGPQNIFDYFVEVSGRPTIYRMNKTAYEKVAASENTLQDRKWPFNFPMEKVSEVEYKTSGLDLIIKKTGDDWVLESDNKEIALDKNRLPTFFERIKALEAEEFLPAKFAKGLNPEKNRIAMKDSAGNTIFKLVWGDEFNKGKQDAIAMVYATTNLTKELIGVKTGAMTAIPSPVVAIPKKVEGEKK